MSPDLVRRFYILLTVFFGGVTLFLIGLIPLQMTLGELPLVGGGEVAVYLGGEGGAFSAALAWICARVVKDPPLSSRTAGPMGVALLGMVAVRFVIYTLGDSMAGQVGGAMIGEMVAFTALGIAAIRIRVA
jgi:hypothetical protein